MVPRKPGSTKVYVYKTPVNNKLYKAVLPAPSKYICDKQSQQINSSIYLYSILQDKKRGSVKMGFKLFLQTCNTSCIGYFLTLNSSQNFTVRLLIQHSIRLLG